MDQLGHSATVRPDLELASSVQPIGRAAMLIEGTGLPMQFPGVDRIEQGSPGRLALVDEGGHLVIIEAGEHRTDDVGRSDVVLQGEELQPAV